jgi:hypothetical protein
MPIVQNDRPLIWFPYNPRQARHGAGQFPKAKLAAADLGDPAVLANWVRRLT